MVTKKKTLHVLSILVWIESLSNEAPNLSFYSKRMVSCLFCCAFSLYLRLISFSIYILCKVRPSKENIISHLVPRSSPIRQSTYFFPSSILSFKELCVFQKEILLVYCSLWRPESRYFIVFYSLLCDKLWFHSNNSLSSL